MFEKTVNKTKAWKKLESHYKHFRKVEMKDLFACDADRAKKFSVNLEAMYVDYPSNLSEELRGYLSKKGIDRKWCH